MLQMTLNVVLPFLAAASRLSAAEHKNVATSRATQPGQFMPGMPPPPQQNGLPVPPQMPQGMNSQMPYGVPQMPAGMAPGGIPPMPPMSYGYNPQMTAQSPQMPYPGGQPQLSLAGMPPGGMPPPGLANMDNINLPNPANLPPLPPQLNKQFGAQAALLGLPTIAPLDPMAVGLPPSLDNQQVPALPSLGAASQAVLNGQAPQLPQLSQAEMAQFVLPTLGPLGGGLKKNGKGKGKKAQLSLANVKLPPPEQVYAQNPGLSPEMEGQMEGLKSLLQGQQVTPESVTLPPLMANALPPDAMPNLDVPDASAGASLPALANLPNLGNPGLPSPMAGGQLPPFPALPQVSPMAGGQLPSLPALPQVPGGPMDSSLLSQSSTMGQTELPPLPSLPGVTTQPVNLNDLPPIPTPPPMPPGVSAQAGIPGYSSPMSQAQIQQILAAAPMPPTGIAEPPPPPSDMDYPMPVMPAGPVKGARPGMAGLQTASGSGSQSGSQLAAATKISEEQAKAETDKFNKWLDSFHQYQNNYMKQQQQWRNYRSAMAKGATGLQAKFLPELPPIQTEAMIPGDIAALMPPSPLQKPSYVEKSSSTKRMKGSSGNQQSQLLKQQSALHSMAAQLMQREQSDFQREKADAAHEAQLRDREIKLNAQEKRVAQFQTTLVQEQKRMWKQVKALQAKMPQASANKGKSAPNTENAARNTQDWSINSPRRAPKEALLQRTSQVKSQTQAAQTTTTEATTTSTTTTTTQVQHPLRMRPQETPAMVQTGTKEGSQSGAWYHGSDLHIVQAAQLPAASVDDEDASGADAGGGDDEDSGAKAGGDAASEDSAATGAEDAKGEFADNDDLEQILLQQSSKVRRSSDAVEITGPAR